MLWAAKQGISGGSDAEHFSPDASCKRGQLVTFLWRAAGKPAVDYAMSFSDVSADAYYIEAVLWAASLGIVSGYGDGRFGVNDPITREQMASILYRYADYKGYDATARASLDGFGDGDEVSAWATEQIAWAGAEKLMAGVKWDV